MNPSKLPWTLRKHPQLPCFIQGPIDPAMGYALEVFGDDYAGYGGRAQRQSDMEFAVVACNVHDKLVAALRGLMKLELEHWNDIRVAAHFKNARVVLAAAGVVV